MKKNTPVIWVMEPSSFVIRDKKKNKIKNIGEVLLQNALFGPFFSFLLLIQYLGISQKTERKNDVKMVFSVVLRCAVLMPCLAKKNKKEQQPFHYKNMRVKCTLNQADAEQTDTSERANPNMSCSPAKCGTVS